MGTGQTSTVAAGIIETNKVIRNTYWLLSITLLFSAFTAWLSIQFNMPHPGIILTLVGYFGLLFLTNNFAKASDFSALITQSSKNINPPIRTSFLGAI